MSAGLRVKHSSGSLKRTSTIQRQHDDASQLCPNQDASGPVDAQCNKTALSYADVLPSVPLRGVTWIPGS